MGNGRLVCQFSISLYEFVFGCRETRVVSEWASKWMRLFFALSILTWQHTHRKWNDEMRTMMKLSGGCPSRRHSEVVLSTNISKCYKKYYKFSLMIVLEIFLVTYFGSAIWTTDSVEMSRKREWTWKMVTITNCIRLISCTWKSCGNGSSAGTMRAKYCSAPRTNTTPERTIGTAVRRVDVQLGVIEFCGRVSEWSCSSMTVWCSWEGVIISQCTLCLMSM